MKLETFKAAYFDLLDETFEHVHGIYLDKGTSLLETLSGVSAEVASRAVSKNGTTIAAHVKHVEFYLTVLEQALSGKDPGKVDWNEIWRTTRGVSESEWQALVGKLKETYRRLLGKLKSIETWDEEHEIWDPLAIVTHTAYHLGAIRQALRVVGESGAGNEAVG